VPGGSAGGGAQCSAFIASRFMLSQTSQLSVETDAARLKCRRRDSYRGGKWRNSRFAARAGPGDGWNIVAIKLPPMQAKPTVASIDIPWKSQGAGLTPRWCFKMPSPVAPRDIHTWINEFFAANGPDIGAWQAQYAT